MNTKSSITFSELIKQEISHISFDEKEAKFLLLSFFINNGKQELVNDDNCFLVTTYFLSNIRLIKKLIDQLKLNWQYEIYESNIKSATCKTKWLIKINNFNEVNEYFNKFTYNLKKMNSKYYSSFFIGAFLSGGSLSFSKEKSNYHFEIRSHNEQYLQDILWILNKLNIQASFMKYRHAYKIYVKKSETISDILKLLKTNDALYTYEDFRIQRDFSNSLQRVNNLDISNINKTIVAANHQLVWIQTIKNKHQYDNLDERTKLFCEARINNPEASLDELSKIINKEHNINIPRTSLNHLIRKIKKIYLEIKSKENI